MSVQVGIGRDTTSVAAFLRQEMKPKDRVFTPFNIVSLPVILAGVVIVVVRFANGLGAVTNLNQEYPWGFWIGFDVITGVAFAGGAYILTFAVYVMGKEKYQPIVRATVLNGFLAYLFYAGALVLDVGRPWHIVNPIIGNSFGYNSILFLVAWHFLLYMLAEFVEFSPTVAEWLGLPRARRILGNLTVGTVIIGVTLSTLHQSGLGALFLLAKAKLHPLWYTEFLPVLFLLSSVFAGIAMIVVEGSISHRVFRDQIDPKRHNSFEDIVFGLSRGASVALFVYFFFKILVFVHGMHWSYLDTGWGLWFLLELLGFVMLPCIMFAKAFLLRKMRLAQAAAVVTLVGIILNRLNISVIAFNWNSSARYFPSICEIVVTLMIIFAEIWVFRWVVNRMSVLRDAPGRAGTH
jgi:Ni/Fe-hydrogenase subunit HybB-like protein